MGFLSGPTGKPPKGFSVAHRAVIAGDTGSRTQARQNFVFANIPPIRRLTVWPKLRCL